MFKYDSNSILKVVPANIPYVVKLNNPSLIKIISESRYKPVGNDFSFSTSISDIAVNPSSNILFISFPYLETNPDSNNSLHINGFLASVYLSGSEEICSKVTGSENCEGPLATDIKEKERNLKQQKAKEPTKESTSKYLSIADGPLSPTVSITISVDPTEFTQPKYDKGFHFVDLDITQDANFSNDIRTVAAARGSNVVSGIELRPNDPYFPLLKQTSLRFLDASGFTSREGINTFGESVCVTGKTKRLGVLTVGNKILSGNLSNSTLKPITASIDDISPTLVSSIPG